MKRAEGWRAPVRLATCAAALLVGCDAPPPTDIRFSIDPRPGTCGGFVPDIRSVRITIIGARSGIWCVEATRCLQLTRRANSIAEVQPALPAGLSFDVIAGRGYQFEAIGFGTANCTAAGSFNNYRFCGQSDAVKFDHDQTVSIPVLCASRESFECASINASLRPCL